MNDSKYTNFLCWRYFALNRQEELYEVISLMINEKLNELIPIKIDEYMKNLKESIDINITTKLNGKAASLDGLKADLTKIITDSIKK